MSKQLRNSKMASFKLDIDLLNWVDKYSEDTGISKTRIIENAIKNYKLTLDNVN